MHGVALDTFAPKSREMPVSYSVRRQLAFERIARKVWMALRVRNAADVSQQVHTMQVEQFKKNRQRMIRVTDRE